MYNHEPSHLAYNQDLENQLLIAEISLQKPKAEKKNAINYHLMRMYPKVVGPKKRKT